MPSGPEHVLFRSIRNHLTLLLKRERLKPDAGFNLSVDFYGFGVFFVRTDRASEFKRVDEMYFTGLTVTACTHSDTNLIRALRY